MINILYIRIKKKYIYIYNKFYNILFYIIFYIYYILYFIIFFFKKLLECDRCAIVLTIILISIVELCRLDTKNGRYLRCIGRKPSHALRTFL